MIHYVAYYSTENNSRIANLAGEDKINYICEVMQRMGEKITIVSNAKSKNARFISTEKIVLKDNVELIMFSSLSNRNSVIHAIDVLWGYIQLFLYLCLKVKKDDIVLVYHSLGYRGFFKYIRKVKRFHYILEVEELFQYVSNSKSLYKKKENNLFNKADAYLFSNSILAEKINGVHKPFVVINGVYRENNRVFLQMKNNKDKIRVVYAGSLDKQKGVDYLIKTAPFLSSKYEIHIIGFGGKEDLERVNRLIVENTMDKKCIITYDGILVGIEYDKFLQSCDIGVCIQDPNDIFNQFEYPSKIFSYLSNGLNVVINDLNQVKRSSVYKYLHVAESTKPEDIAASILKCECIAKEKMKNILRKLDLQFEKELGLLFDKIREQ